MIGMRSIDQMIAEQVRTWAKRQAIRDVRGESPRSWPVITISREFGARGAALAAELGERIGFEVWDRELLVAIAERSGADEKLLSSLDERRRTAIDDVVRGTLTGFQHTNTQYFRTLLRVLHTISTHGKCIIVGRGANYVSRASNTLRVRVVAPLEVRIRNYAERQSIGEAEARKTIAIKDAERADFIKYYFKRDIGCPSDYDLVINSDTYSLEHLADIVLAAYECTFRGTSP